MQSFVFAAYFLASLITANPVDLEPRGLSFASNHQSESLHKSSETSSSSGFIGGAPGGDWGDSHGLGAGHGGQFGGVGAGQFGGSQFGGVGAGQFGGSQFGGVGGGQIAGYGQSSSFSAQSSSSYSSVVSGFSALVAQCAYIRNLMQSSTFSQTIALQYMSRLASSLRLELSQSLGCGCFGQGNFISTVNSFFTEFHSIMIAMQSMFSGSFNSIVGQFSSLSSVFQSFCSTFSSSGSSLGAIIPSGLLSILGFDSIAGFK